MLAAAGRRYRPKPIAHPRLALSRTEISRRLRCGPTSRSEPTWKQSNNLTAVAKQGQSELPQLRPIPLAFPRTMGGRNSLDRRSPSPLHSAPLYQRFAGLFRPAKFVRPGRRSLRAARNVRRRTFAILLSPLLDSLDQPLVRNHARTTEKANHRGDVPRQPSSGRTSARRRRLAR